MDNITLDKEERNRMIIEILIQEDIPIWFLNDMTDLLIKELHNYVTTGKDDKGIYWGTTQTLKHMKEREAAGG
jgi:hypothetical protein